MSDGLKAGDELTADSATKPSDEIRIERAIDEAEEHESGNGYFYIIVGVLVILFAGLIFYSRAGTPTGALTFEDLHKMNLEGELSEDKGYVYNGFSFVFFDGLWYTDVEVRDTLYRIPLHFGPRDVEEVFRIGNLSDNFNSGEDVYITINPLSDGQEFIALAASELAQNIAVGINRRPVGACDRNETSMCRERPTVTCNTTDHAMIYLTNEGGSSGGPEVVFDGLCIIARGLGYDLVKAVDSIILEWYNVR